MKAVINAQIVLEYGIIWDGGILIDNDEIKNFGKNIEIPEDAEIIDASGAYVGPGFVDIHVHGGGGYNTIHEPKEAAEHFLKHGETTILATPSYNKNFKEFLGGIRLIKKEMSNLRNVRGMYMEGPYTNPKYGSHSDLNPWRHPINPDEYKVLVDEAGELAKVWTIAPEREGIFEFVEYAKKVNPDAVIAVGHSEATPMQIRAMGKYAPKLQTHSMCATGQSTAWAGTRGMGPDEYCFKENDVFCELISDSLGAHVSSEMQQLLLHNKGVNRIVLISDSTVFDEKYPAPEGLEDAVDLNFDDKNQLAGSRLTMNMACKNIMSHTSCGIVQAFVMASLNPAKVIGLDSEIGSIFPGKIADLVFVDDRFNVKHVILEGEKCKF